jgi:hypothetical protein
MAAPNFNDILSQTIESVERPALPPMGHYVMNINSIPRMDSTKEKWDIIEFPLKGVRASDDVDPDMLKEYGAATSVTARLSFMFDKEDAASFDQTRFRLKTFLENHVGVDPALSIKEALNDCVNKQILVEINYRPDKADPSILYVNVKSTAAVE